MSLCKDSAEYIPVATEEAKEPIRNIEDFLHMKRYCILILVFSEFILFAGAGNMIYMMFAGAAPKKVSCESDSFSIGDACNGNWTPQELTNCTIKTEHEFKSVNVEFGYLCNDTHWVKSSISVQMTGVMLGTVIFGSLSDKMGRKKILIICFLFTSVFSVFASFSHSLLTFTVMRTLVGVFNGGLMGIYGVYKMEHISKKHRFWVTAIIAWAPNLIALNAIAYLSHDWRSFQIAITIGSLPAFILFYFVKESPRFLLHVGKVEEARKVMEYIQKMNRETQETKDQMNKMIDKYSEINLSTAQEGKKSYSLLHLFYTKEMAFATLVFSLGIFVTNVVNYGLMFNMEKLSGSIFLNSTLLGCIRWSLNIIAGILDYKFKCIGRKTIHLIAQTVITFSLFCMAIGYYKGVEETYAGIIRVTTIMAVGTTSQIFITKGVLSMEYYPTAVRNSGMAFKSVFSRFGTIAAPQVFIWAPFRSLPYFILSILAFFDCVAFQVILPETKGNNLPDAMPTKNKEQSLRDQ